MRTQLKVELKIAQGIEDSIVVWTKGHAFARCVYGAKCVGCGESVQTTAQSPSPVNIKTAALERKSLGECSKPWSFSKRVQELEKRHRERAARQNKTQASEITLESVNAKLDAIDAKLDRIIRHWRIYR